LLAAWRVLAITQANRWASSDPVRALRWVPDHPEALAAVAERHLAAGRFEDATGSARRLLSVAPLEGRGFRILAEAAVGQGDSDRALGLYRIAVRRSPRDARARAWLIEHSLVSGDYPDALQHIDSLLRTAPRYASALLPLLAKLSVDEGFAAELARVLERRPPWRANLLATLQAAEDPRAADTVLTALRNAGGLSEAEYDEWIAYLIRQGRWGEAYGRWASTLDLAGRSLPVVYNGQFEQPVSSRGFDWRLTRVPGVSVEFVPDGSARGLVAHASFRGRPVAQVNLEQPLLLGPGRHRFSARMRADGLRSERGLEWTITCLGQNTPFATSGPIQGTFGWREVTMDLDVPSSECAGQWLRLRNPVGPGSIQQVSGDLWFDGVAMQYSPAGFTD